MARGRPAHPDVLTPAEWRIVHAVRHGMTNREIARRRGISLDAVKFHIDNALGKLGLENRAALRKWHGAPIESAVSRKGASMTTTTSKLGRIGQIARHVTDVSKAVAWYRDVFGLTHLYTFPSPEGDLAFFDCGGTRLFLSRRRQDSPGEQNVLYFSVPDIDVAYDDLQARGVEFISAPHMIHRHQDGTEEWMAFFKDPDGQVLSILSQVKS
ncbi:MAG: hypothetical protein GEV06_28525 [Luteitalea sp.]|nr:hypothetical protein [Luteitalea sp.]